MSVILDSSAAVAWVMPDESTEKLRAVFEAVSRMGAIVPALWWTETANSLCMAQRRGRIDAAFIHKALMHFAKLPIQTDDETITHAWSGTLELAQTHRLTCYDATYLELAIRKSAPLATFDRELAAAARAAGVRVVGG